MPKIRNYCTKLLVGVAVCGGLWGCMPNIAFKEGEYFLYKLDVKGNTGVEKDELLSIVPTNQRPNSRPLSLPVVPRVAFLAYGRSVFNEQQQLERKARLEQEQKAGKFSRRRAIRLARKLGRIDENLANRATWFWRTVGEEPAIITEKQVAATAQTLQRYLRGRGFRDARVDYELLPMAPKPRIDLHFLVEANQPYLIDSVIYDVADAKLAGILTADTLNKRIAAGQRFDIERIIEERARLEIVAKNNGYYKFSNGYIRHGAVNDQGGLEAFKARQQGDLYLGIENPPGQSRHQSFRVEKILFRTVEITQMEKAKLDTVMFRGIHFLTLPSQIPYQSIANRMMMHTGELFSLQKLVETQRQLGLLNQFAFSSYSTRELTDSTLAIEFFAPMLDKYTASATPGINNIIYNNNAQNFTGFGIPVVLSMRNNFRRLETIDLSTNFAYEGQPSPINSNEFRGSLAAGANLSVSYPRILLPGLRQRYILQNPRTSYSAGLNYSEPFWARRFNFNAKANYSWQPSMFKRYFLSLIDLSLINTFYNIGDENTAGTRFYNELVAQQALGNNLKVTFDPQFVSTISGSYLYNNQNPAERYGSARYFRIFAESGGTVMNLLKDKNRIGLIENLFPISNKTTGSDSARAYFQFLKLNVDYRRYLPISLKSGWAYRFNVGVINPYGKNRSVPYEKNFFAGGSNSVRAWSPLSLGNGSAKPDVTSDGNVIPQPGDILLETSVEYRRTVFKLFGDIQLATFIDAGNTWKWYTVPNKPNQSNFDIDRFYKEFAVGTGFGVRWDLTYFLLRSDWGIKVFDPAQPAGQKFVLDNFNFGKRNGYGLQWQFGIGYPF